MNPQRILAIVDKEWTQAFATWSSRVKLAVPPIFAGVFLVAVFMMLRPSLFERIGILDAEAAAKAANDPNFKAAMAANVRFMLDFFLAFFMTLPMVSASQVAVTGLTGDKKSRSLEPLLATPLTSVEFLVGKILAATIPAIGIGWISYLAFAVVSVCLGVGKSLIFGSLFGTIWLTSVFVISPLFAVLITVIAFYYSSRISDVHRAEMACQQMAGAIMIVPVVGITIVAILAQSHNFGIHAALMKITVALFLLNGFLFFLCIKLFQRETVLFKWK
jgi:ABC-2 type transport system permease protein